MESEKSKDKVQQSQHSGAAGILQGLMDSAKDSVQGTDSLTKKKAVIIGSWIFLSLIAVVIAFAPYVADGVRSMDARLKVSKIESLTNSITAFYLENSGRSSWEDRITLTLNETYTTLASSVEPGKNIVIQLERFATAEGEIPPSDIELVSFRVETSAGKIAFDLRDCVGTESKQCTVTER